MSTIGKHSDLGVVVADSSGSDGLPPTPLSAEEIASTLAVLEGEDRPAKIPALRWIQTRRDDFIPHLLASLDEAISQVERGVTPNYISFFAQFLLTEFRQESAVPLFLRILHLPDNASDQILGDATVELLPWMLSVLIPPGQIDWLDELIRDRGCDCADRRAAIRCYQHLYQAGKLPREIVVQRLVPLLRESLTTPDETTANLTGALLDLSAMEVEDDLRAALKLPEVLEALEYLDGDDELEHARGLSTEQIHNRLRLVLADGFTDTVDELLAWSDVLRDGWPSDRGVEDWDAPVSESEIAMFHELVKMLGRDRFSPNAAPHLNDIEDIASLPADEPYDDVADPIRYEAPLVGRNDPCPCGSGKKFKKCCLSKVT